MSGLESGAGAPAPTPILTSEANSFEGGRSGLVILPDGTKYICSVRHGTVARIRKGEKAEPIASGIPSAASMCYDSRRNRLVIPMNDWNAITIVELDPVTDSR
jgi:hypothetical protein